MHKSVSKNSSLRLGALVVKCAEICGIARLRPGGGWAFPPALDFLIGHISLWQWRAVRREYPQS
jgi:hypothetical protein